MGMGSHSWGRGGDLIGLSTLSGEDGVPEDRSSLVQEGEETEPELLLGEGVSGGGAAGGARSGSGLQSSHGLGSARSCAAGRFSGHSKSLGFGFFRGRPFSQPPPFPPLAAAPSGRGERSCPRRWLPGRGGGAGSDPQRDLGVLGAVLWAVELEYKVTRRTPERVAVGFCLFVLFRFDLAWGFWNLSF